MLYLKLLFGKIDFLYHILIFVVLITMDPQHLVIYDENDEIIAINRNYNNEYVNLLPVDNHFVFPGLKCVVCGNLFQFCFNQVTTETIKNYILKSSYCISCNKVFMEHGIMLRDGVPECELCGCNIDQKNRHSHMFEYLSILDINLRYYRFINGNDNKIHYCNDCYYSIPIIQQLIEIDEDIKNRVNIEKQNEKDRKQNEFIKQMRQNKLAITTKIFNLKREVAIMQYYVSFIPIQEIYIYLSPITKNLINVLMTLSSNRICCFGDYCFPIELLIYELIPIIIISYENHDCSYLLRIIGNKSKMNQLINTKINTIKKMQRKHTVLLNNFD